MSVLGGKKTVENGQKMVAYLGSMRILQPATNGAASSGFQLTLKAQSLFSLPSPDTDEISVFTEDKKGSYEKYIDPIEGRLQRWVLQSAIRHLLPEKRVSTCFRLRASGQDTINVMHNPILKSAHYAGAQTCGSVWDCPICAIKISERRRVDEVLPAMEQWNNQGGQCLLLTLTNPHFIHTVLADLLKGQQKAMCRLTGSRAFRRFLKSIGCVGTIRAWEVTYGVNGWHPHFHIILFVQTGLDLVLLEEQFYLFWSNACRLAKLPLPDRLHGVRLHDGLKAHAYASKGLWGLDYEITKGHLKKSKGGRSPMDLIRSYVFNDDKQAAALFVEYSKGFHRKCQLQWSPGLKTYFGIGVKTDEQLAAEQDEQASLLGRIEWATWKLVLRSELRGEIIELGRLGSWEAILCLLDSLVVENLKMVKS